MCNAPMGMARAPALDCQIKSDGERDFVLEGVFIHPDHLAQGFFADEMADSSCSETSSIVGYDDEDAPVAELTGLALNCAFGESTQDQMQDYFAPRPGSSNPSSFYSNSTTSSMASSLFDASEASSSTATTPTCESAFKPAFSRRSSVISVCSDVASPSIPATFSFSAFSAPGTASAPMTRAPSRNPSPTRAHPYTRSSGGGASMTRSVSSPVETHRQVEERQRRMSVAEVVMDERAVKMARSKSGASTPMRGSFPPSPTGGVSMAHTSSKPLFSPLMASSSVGWGNIPVASPFLGGGRPRLAPTRSARAHSFAGMENYYMSPPAALAEHRHSVANISYVASSPSSSSPLVNRNSRRLSRIFPLTPILAQSPELDEEPSCAVQAAATLPDAPVVLSRGRLHRGMTF
ncbi:hypothetical protein JCM3770_000289 [Rhodotorula araucariae]